MPVIPLRPQKEALLFKSTETGPISEMESMLSSEQMTKSATESGTNFSRLNYPQNWTILGGRKQSGWHSATPSRSRIFARQNRT
jgi:hypothetical protein